MRRHSVLLAVFLAVVAFGADTVGGSVNARPLIVVSSTPEQLADVLAELDPTQTVHRMYWYPRGSR